MKQHDEDDEKREADLRSAHDEPEKCFKLADYRGAATAKEKVAALTSAEPCSQTNHGPAQAEWPAGLAASYGADTATSPSAGKVKAETHADVKWKEKRDLEDEERRQTELRGANDDLKK